MPLAVAIPAAVLGAVAFGGSTAVQHVAAHDETEGGLATLLRNPRWWLSIGGDGVGFALQILALATGPVVLVQPIFILSLPVALPIRRRFGGPAVRPADYAACVVLALGLGGFFVLSGDPGEGLPLTTRTAVWLIGVALVGGLALVGAAYRASPTVRALVGGCVAGAYWGVMAVLVNAVSVDVDQHGWSALGRATALTAAIGGAVIGLLGFALAQMAFQAGALGASFPAMLVLDPLIAVLLGVSLLHQRIDLSVLRVAGYAVCLVLIVVATLRLAGPGPAAGQNAADDPRNVGEAAPRRRLDV